MIRCVWCGEDEVVEIGEIWGHDYTVDTCCLARHEQLLAEMADDPDWATGFLRALGVEALTGYRLRRLYDGSFNAPVLDFRLTTEPVDFASMQAFVGQHHAHCPPPVAWRFGAAIHNGATRIGVVSVGNPVSPALMRRGWLEVNRLCIRRDVAPQLTWNACSQLYGFAAKEAARRGFGKVVTYTRIDEPGTSLIAAGWVRETTVRGRGWNSARRPRSNRNGWIDKVRWSRTSAPATSGIGPRHRPDRWLQREALPLGT